MFTLQTLPPREAFPEADRLPRASGEDMAGGRQRYAPRRLNELGHEEIIEEIEIILLSAPNS